MAKPPSYWDRDHPPITPKKPAGPAKVVGGGALCAIVGAACAAILTPFVSNRESSGQQHLTAYHGQLDPPGVWTVCDGDTIGVTKNMVETPQGCALRLDTRLAQFSKPVLACTPGLNGHPYQLAAAVSLAYNIGPPSYCASTVAKRFRANQWASACAAFMAWDMAGGKHVLGLRNRRDAERLLCLKGLPV